MRKRIGIDLDNTILRYDALFHSLALERSWIQGNCPQNKGAVKRALINQSREDQAGDQLWQQLQAWAYGKRIDEAELFEGFDGFVRQARKRGDELFIVSHKTRFSSFSPSIDLRRQAMKTLERRGFFTSSVDGGFGFRLEDVFFASSLEEKVEMISGLRLDCFIDDLIKVFGCSLFPKETRALLFSPLEAGKSLKLESYGTWHEIADHLNLWHWAESCFAAKLHHLKPLGRGGNNRLHRAEFENGDRCAIKNYLHVEGDNRPRIYAEFEHLMACWELGFRNIPQPLFRTDGFASYSLIEGKPVETPEASHMEQVLAFLVDLDGANSDLQRFPVKSAAESRYCLRDFVSRIEARWERINKGCGLAKWGGEVLDFMAGDLELLKKYVIERFFQFVEQENLDLDLKRTPQELILSPSDFGFHNILVDEGGKLYFLDFEYSGWDDPAKLLADFFHHAGQNVSWECKWFLLERFADHRKWDTGFLRRWYAVIDLIGLEWVLIVLNLADPVEMKRKLFANPRQKPEVLVKSQLGKAAEMIRKSKVRMDRGEERVTVPGRGALALN
ncbi:MAG: phosphotransferase [Desulfobacterales bacterium]|nr:phosphotransferase [Desulfobacterales bacterium]